MEKHKILEVLEDAKLENSSLWIKEAQFGFTHLKEKFKSLSDESNVLEVGCGSGILLAMLAEYFPTHKFSGIEPLGGGFSHLEELNLLVKKMGVSIDSERYEQCQPQSKYDFIYCVNVFEHVEDWRHFLCWANDNLNDGGVFFVLCPNYGFPYESHFRIPIIFSKKLTYNIFKRRITRFEQTAQSFGLWDSLNFVKKREIKSFCSRPSIHNLSMVDETSIIDHMVMRLSEDSEFRERQAFVGIFATLINAIGAFGLLKKFPNFLPYMQLIFTKID